MIDASIAAHKNLCILSGEKGGGGRWGGGKVAGPPLSGGVAALENRGMLKVYKGQTWSGDDLQWA